MASRFDLCWLVCGSILAATGCSTCLPGSTFTTSCQSDDDCAAGYSCQPSTGHCMHADAGNSTTDAPGDRISSDRAARDAATQDRPAADGGLFQDGPTSADGLVATDGPVTLEGSSATDGPVAADGALPEAAVDAGFARCGDSTLDIPDGEECDDGNRVTGDGCDSQCQLEPVGAQCGDGLPQPPAKCDYGDRVNGDDCNPTCNLENTVSTLATGLTSIGLASDDQWLWFGSCQNSPSRCTIERIDRRACLAIGDCARTVVAGALCGTPVDGVGTSAVFKCAETLVSDGTTLWIGDDRTIRTLDISTTSVHTVAGNLSLRGTRDGVGDTAVFAEIRGLTYDRGHIYLLDGCDAVLRRFDPETSRVITLAGSPTTSHEPLTGSLPACTNAAAADGFGDAARFTSPRYMTADHSGALYISDIEAHSLRRYDIATRYVATLVSGNGYRDGVGAAVQLERPRGLATDGTSLYWREQWSYTVRQLEIQTGTASTLVGVRGCNGSLDGIGGDGTQNWRTSQHGCTDPAVTSMPLFESSVGDIVFDFEHRALLLLDNGRLRRIE